MIPARRNTDPNTETPARLYSIPLPADKCKHRDDGNPCHLCIWESAARLLHSRPDGFQHAPRTPA